MYFRIFSNIKYNFRVFRILSNNLFFFHLALTGSSTSSLRHHIRTKHPRDWAKVVEAEKSKAEQDAANKAEAKKLQEEMEGDPDEDEEDLTPSTPQPTPGTSKKRPAVADDTPQRPKKLPRISPRRNMFTKVVKHNIKDKRQLTFDLRFCRYLVGNNCSMAHAGTEETIEFFEEYLPIFHIKNPSTFTRY